MGRVVGYCCMWGRLDEELDTIEMRHTGEETLMEEWNRRGCSFFPWIMLLFFSPLHSSLLLSQQRGVCSQGGCVCSWLWCDVTGPSSLSFLLVCGSVKPASTSVFYPLPSPHLSHRLGGKHFFSGTSYVAILSACLSVCLHVVRRPVWRCLYLSLCHL